MSTRSGIILKRAEDYAGIYCHWDGYPGGVGAMLKKHYTDFGKIQKLIDLGDISALKEKVDPCTSRHSFDTPEPDVTIAYGRDRGEEGVDAKKGSHNFVCGELRKMGAEYLYLFKDGQWTCKYL